MSGKAKPEPELRYIGGCLIDPTIYDEYPIPFHYLSSDINQKILSVALSTYRQDNQIDSQTFGRTWSKLGYGDVHSGESVYTRTVHYLSKKKTGPVVRRIKELYLARTLREPIKELGEACSVADVDKICSLLRQAQQTTEDVQVDAKTPITAREGVALAIETLITLEESTGRHIRFGFPTLDRSYSISGGQLVVIGAQTNVGKSSTILSMFDSVANRGTSCGLISLEDSVEEYMMKLIALRIGVNSADLWQRGLKALSSSQRDRLQSLTNELCEDYPLHLDFVADRTIESTLAAMTHMVKVQGCRVIAIDYLQAMQLPKAATRRDAVDKNLGDLIAHAGRLNVGLVLASQLRRPADNPFREPSKHDLKESGTIEERAQLIVMLWKEAADADRVRAKIEKAKRVPCPQYFDLGRHPVHGGIIELDTRQDTGSHEFEDEAF